MKYLGLLAIMFFVFSCNGQSSSSQTSDAEKTHSTDTVAVKINKVIDADEFELKIKDLENITLIDVRTPEEVEEGFIEGAILLNIHDPEFANKLAELNKDIPTYVYCRSGGRSGKAATQLKALGFNEVYDLDGGFTEWQKQNKPISTF